MIRFATIFRVVLPVALATALPAQTVLSPAAGSSAVTSPTDPAPPLLSELPGWVHSETLRSSMGWRDNVLLSSFAPIRRAFGRAEFEMFLLRQRGDWQLLSFLNGDVLRYFSPPPETGGEQQWFLHGELRWRHRPAWQVALKADGFLQDAVIDLSEVESIRTVAPMRAQGVFATLTTRVMLPAGFAFEPLGQVKRVAYRDFPGDYDETKAGAQLEWKRSAALVLSATWFEHRRGYANRPQYTAGGRALKGTLLHFWQREGELRASTAWSLGGQWTVALTASRLENRDRASGFFDYNQTRGRLELTWRRAKWKLRFDGDRARTEYLIQTVGAGIAPPPRVADNFETSFRVERELTGAWKVFAQHRWEGNVSNEREFNYRANTLLAGLQKNF